MIYVLTVVAWFHVTFFDADIWAARRGLWALRCQVWTSRCRLWYARFQYHLWELGL